MKAYDFDCPIEATLLVIGGKWKASSIYYLAKGSKRFGELMQLHETVSGRILSKQLQELERDGVVERKLFNEMPPRVEYSLTDYGKTLIPLIDVICQWGEARLDRLGKRAVYN